MSGEEGLIENPPLDNDKVCFESKLVEYLGLTKFFGEDSSTVQNLLQNEECYRKISGVFEETDFLEMGIRFKEATNPSQLKELYKNVFEKEIESLINPFTEKTSTVSSFMSIYLKYHPIFIRN